MAKWVPHTLVSKKDRRKAKKLVEASLPPGKREAARFREFIVFNRLSHQPIIYGVGLMATSMRRRGLKSSTISTYIRKIASYHFNTLAVRTRYRMRRMAERIEETALLEIRRTAPVWQRADADQLLIAVTSPVIRAVVDFLSNAPFRVCDLIVLHGTHVTVGKQFVEIKVHGGKTRKRLLDREMVRVKRSVLAPSTVKYLRGFANCPLEKVFPVTTAIFNDRILEWAGRPCTSYSLRNMWIREVIISHRDAEGKTDWEAVCKTTLHRSTKALKSHYGFLFDGEGHHDVPEAATPVS